MHIITYTALCYGLTAVISLLVIAIVIGVNSVVSKLESKSESK
jgi:hypothetical protein